MSRKQIAWAYFGLIIYMIGPMLCALLASSVAYVTGSRLDEGSVHPCIVLGLDIGGLLSALFVMGWLSLVTIPTGILGIVGLSIALLVVRNRRAKDEKSRRLEGLAVASIVFSVMSVMIGPFGAVPGIACGYVAKRRIERNPELAGKELARAGMIISCAGMFVFVVLMALKQR